MTLCMTIIAPWGIWQSSDFRLSTMMSSVVNDRSIKHVRMICTNGIGLITYTGFGRPPGSEQDLSDWVRRIIGDMEPRTVHESLCHICDAATAALGNQLEHAFVVGVLENQTAHLITIRNIAPNRSGKWVRTSRFHVYREAAPRVRGRVAPSYLYVAGSGSAFLTPSLIELLGRFTGKRPKEPERNSAVLAYVNSQVATRTPTVSQECLTTFVPPTGDGGCDRFHGITEDEFPDPGSYPISPVVFQGLDLTDVMRDFARACDWDDLGRPDIGTQIVLKSRWPGDPP